MSFIQKYAPKTFGEYVGSKTSRIALNILKDSYIGNGALKRNHPNDVWEGPKVAIIGPKGGGKTTLARLMAKACYCDKGPDGGPCGVCAHCQDFEHWYYKGELYSNAVTKFDDGELVGAPCSTEIINTSTLDTTRLRKMMDYLLPFYEPTIFSMVPVYIFDEAHRMSREVTHIFLHALDYKTPAILMFCVAKERTRHDDNLHKMDRAILRRLYPLEISTPDFGEVMMLAKKVVANEGLKVKSTKALGRLLESVNLIPNDVLRMLEMAKICKEEITEQWVEESVKAIVTGDEAC